MSYKMAGISRATESFSRWTLLHGVGQLVGWLVGWLVCQSVSQFNLVNKVNLLHNFS
jgi:hypothetical protein